MRIKKVAFWDNLREWRFEPIYFSNLALLVEVSGVGKTQILKGISRLKEIANRFTKRCRSQNPPHDDTNLDGKTAPREEVERDRVAPFQAPDRP